MIIRISLIGNFVAPAITSGNKAAAETGSSPERVTSNPESLPALS